MEIEKFIDGLISLRTLLTRRDIKQLERSLSFAVIKNSFSERPNNIREELKLREITRKK